MIVNKCSENLLTKSKKLYENYRDNCIVVQRMLEKYKKIYPNISDYSIMHFIDIAEFCDLIMDRQKLEDLNGDECYCLLMAALFAHTGFGLNQESMNKYISKLGIQKQTQPLSFLQIMNKYHVLFSACLIEEYGDIFEFPSEIYKHAIISMLYFIGGNSDDINQLEEVLLSDNQNSVRLKDLAAVLAVGNQLAELKNTNLDLNYEDFDKYNSEEIVGFVERNVVRSIAVKYGKLVIEAGGSDSAYALIERKVNLIINNFEKLLSSLTHGSGDNAGLFGIDSIELKCVLSAKNSKKIYLNREIEESWTEEDIELRGIRENPDYKNPKLNCVRTALERMIKGYSNLRIELAPSRMVMSNSEGVDLQIDQLSGGYKAVLSVIADIAKRLSMANPDSLNPLEEEAVILIDELDLHLHPKWQKEIVADLKRTFPNSQFIVSTHSPFIVQSLDADELFDIKIMQYAEEGNYRGWSIEAIQEHKMGVEPKTAIFNQYLEEFSSAMDDENYEKAKTLYKELKEMVSPGSHESKILKLDMEMIEADDKA